MSRSKAGQMNYVYPMELFVKGLQATRRYKARFGQANAKFEYKASNGLCLGRWQYQMRKRYGKGSLPPEQINLLQELGFNFDLFVEQNRLRRRGISEFSAYRKHHASADVPFQYRTGDGYRLGRWQQNTRRNYRQGKLSRQAIRELNKLGFLWKSSRRSTRLSWKEFVKRVEATRAYKARYGRANAPYSYRTAHGFRLGQWQSHLRRKYHQDRLIAREIKAMDALGFQWKIRDFERGFQETLRCKAKTGNPNVLREYQTPEGFRLGRWQSQLRCAYQTGLLPKERIKRLTKIGFVWHLIKETYRRGIEETRNYQRKHGAANCPQAYVTAERYRLGEWQSRMKLRRKKGTLTSDIITDLEAMGFEWGRYYSCADDTD